MRRYLSLILFLGLAWGQPEKRHKIQPFKDNALLLNNSIFHPVNEIDYQRENWYLFQCLQQSWDGAQWENNSQYIYTWETLLSINNKNISAEVFTLHQNYPNPFNPTTILRYDLPKDALVNITIYDMMGRVVKTMVNTQQNAGFKSIRWNATNDKGSPVSAGLYLYMIQAGDFRQTKKMVLLK